MRHLLLAFALAAGACAVGHADDKKAEKVPFADLEKDFRAKLKDAKSGEDRQELFKEYGPKFLGVAKQKEKGGFAAAMFAVQIGQVTMNAELKGEALALLKTEYADDPEMARGLGQLERFVGRDYRTFVRAVMTKSTKDPVRAAACSALIEPLEAALAKAEGDEAAKIKKEMDELRKLGVEKYKMNDIFIGGTLPDLKSEDLDGKAVKLSDHKGKVVVLDIWATWCGPCVAMIPHERKLVEKMKGRPFELISVSFDDKKETVTKFMEEEKMPWTHWFNGRKGEVGSQLNVRFFPTIFVLDGKGVIRFKGVRDEELGKAVEKLVKELEDEKKSSE